MRMFMTEQLIYTRKLAYNLNYNLKMSESNLIIVKCNEKVENLVFY
jgi:hypothetical protein